MADIALPQNLTTIWASSGNILKPTDSKIQQGWTAEIPPYQWFNWQMNRNDQAIAHIVQHGISIWDNTVEYQAGKSVVQGSDGILYKATATNTGVNPVNDVAGNWVLFSSTLSSTVALAKNTKMTLLNADVSANISCDELVVENALAGNSYKFANFNQVINLSKLGLGGMDTGLAPASGFVAIYAIYNPSTKALSTVATNVTSVKALEVYSGSNMPAGYTYSSLLSVWPVNSNRQFVIGQQVDRKIYGAYSLLLNTTTNQTTFTPIPINSYAPMNAREIFLSTTASQTSSGAGVILELSGSTAGIGSFGVQSSASSGVSSSTNSGIVPITVGQTIYYKMNTSAPGSYQVYLNGYSF